MSFLALMHLSQRLGIETCTLTLWRPIRNDKLNPIGHKAMFCSALFVLWGRGRVAGAVVHDMWFSNVTGIEWETRALCDQPINYEVIYSSPFSTLINLGHFLFKSLSLLHKLAYTYSRTRARIGAI
jgi:hypothetical protein